MSKKWVWNTGETYWQVKQKVFWENLSQCHFVHQKYHMNLPGINIIPPLWEAIDKPPEQWYGLWALELQNFAQVILKVMSREVHKYQVGATSMFNFKDVMIDMLSK